MNRQQARHCLTELFESWYPALLRYSFRMTRDLELAEDLVQDSFLQLYRDLARGVEITNPKGWTLTVLRRLVLHHYRDARREGVRVTVDNLEAMPAKPDPDMNQFLNGDLAGMFSILSPREEEVLLLRMESLKYREIGDRLGISANSVTTLLSRALKKLRLASTMPVAVHDVEEAHAVKALR
jgi:RNA polymerase sigma factor (sigma-70 family)